MVLLHGKFTSVVGQLNKICTNDIDCAPLPASCTGSDGATTCGAHNADSATCVAANGADGNSCVFATTTAKCNTDNDPTTVDRCGYSSDAGYGFGVDFGQPVSLAIPTYKYKVSYGEPVLTLTTVTQIVTVHNYGCIGNVCDERPALVVVGIQPSSTDLSDRCGLMSPASFTQDTKLDEVLFTGTTASDLTCRSFDASGVEGALELEELDVFDESPAGVAARYTIDARYKGQVGAAMGVEISSLQVGGDRVFTIELKIAQLFKCGVDPSTSTVNGEEFDVLDFDVTTVTVFPVKMEADGTPDFSRGFITECESQPIQIKLKTTTSAITDFSANLATNALIMSVDYVPCVPAIDLSTFLTAMSTPANPITTVSPTCNIAGGAAQCTHCNPNIGPQHTCSATSTATTRALEVTFIVDKPTDTEVISVAGISSCFHFADYYVILNEYGEPSISDIATGQAYTADPKKAVIIARTGCMELTDNGVLDCDAFERCGTNNILDNNYQVQIVLKGKDTGKTQTVDIALQLKNFVCPSYALKSQSFEFTSSVKIFQSIDPLLDTDTSSLHLESGLKKVGEDTSTPPNPLFKATDEAVFRLELDLSAVKEEADHESHNLRLKSVKTCSLASAATDDVKACMLGTGGTSCPENIPKGCQKVLWDAWASERVQQGLEGDLGSTSPVELEYTLMSQFTAVDLSSYGMASSACKTSQSFGSGDGVGCRADKCDWFGSGTDISNGNFAVADLAYGHPFKDSGGGDVFPVQYKNSVDGFKVDAAVFIRGTVDTRWIVDMTADVEACAFSRRRLRSVHHVQSVPKHFLKESVEGLPNFEIGQDGVSGKAAYFVMKGSMDPQHDLSSFLTLDIEIANVQIPADAAWNAETRGALVEGLEKALQGIITPKEVTLLEVTVGGERVYPLAWTQTHGGARRLLGTGHPLLGNAEGKKVVITAAAVMNNSTEASEGAKRVAESTGAITASFKEWLSTGDAAAISSFLSAAGKGDWVVRSSGGGTKASVKEIVDIVNESKDKAKKAERTSVVIVVVAVVVVAVGAYVAWSSSTKQTTKGPTVGGRLIRTRSVSKYEKVAYKKVASRGSSDVREFRF